MWFQSTHSLRSATRGLALCCKQHIVSIHALLAECDFGQSGTGPRKTRFQSTHSLRSATRRRRPGSHTGCVSIHALLAECDSMFGGNGLWGNRFQSTHSLRSATQVYIIIFSPYKRFNPRTPCGVRLKNQVNGYGQPLVSIHALLAECDSMSKSSLTRLPVSIHALLAECDIFS